MADLWAVIEDEILKGRDAKITQVRLAVHPIA